MRIEFIWAACLLGLVFGTEPVTAEPASKIYRLILQEASHEKHSLEVDLLFNGTRFVHGLAFAPKFNRMPHQVDPTGLQLKKGTLSGFLDATLMPDGRIPRDGQPVECIYELSLSEHGGTLKGEHDGRISASDGKRSNYTRGEVTGLEITPPPLGSNYVVTLRVPSFLPTRERPNYPAMVFKVQPARTSAAILPQGKKHPLLKIADPSLSITGVRLSGSLTLEGPKSYRATFSGLITGRKFLGSWKIRSKGQKTFKTTCWGELRDRPALTE